MINASEYMAIVYADIFDYPLTQEERERWEIEGIGQQIKQKKTTYKNGYYCLADRESIFNLRKQREGYSGEKMIIAERISRWLGRIPMVWAVCVTGSLAMRNSDENDDIDLMIITAPGRLWTTRLLCIFITEILGVRRRRREMRVKNKICLNVFLDGGDLLIKNQNLFTAHEVCQAKCLYEKEGVYRKFLGENRWVGKYLPNFQFSIFNFQTIFKSPPFAKASGGRQFSIFENFFKKLQLWFMKRYKTTEKITETQLFFHPESREKKVLDKMRYLAIK